MYGHAREEDLKGGESRESSLGATAPCVKGRAAKRLRCASKPRTNCHELTLLNSCDHVCT